MLIQGIKRGRNIELLWDLDIADGEKVTVEVLPQQKPGNFWEAIVQWRSTIYWDEWDEADPWADVRDRSPDGGLDFSWDD